MDKVPYYHSRFLRHYNPLVT